MEIMTRVQSRAFKGENLHACVREKEGGVNESVLLY